MPYSQELHGLMKWDKLPMCSIWLCVEQKTNVGKIWPLPSRSLHSNGLLRQNLLWRSRITMPDSLSKRKRNSRILKSRRVRVECAGGTETNFCDVFVVTINFSKTVNSSIPSPCPPSDCFPTPSFLRDNYYTVIGV